MSLRCAHARLTCETNSRRWRGHLDRTLAIAVLCLLSGCYFSLVIAPVALGEKAPTVQQGLLPEWLGVREILQRRSPYRQEITDRIQATIYGSAPSARVNQQRFAYPVYFAFLFLPLAVVPFSAARILAFAGCLASTIVSVHLWCRWRRWQSATAVIIAMFVFASYPAYPGTAVMPADASYRWFVGGGRVLGQLRPARAGGDASRAMQREASAGDRGLAAAVDLGGSRWHD